MTKNNIKITEGSVPKNMFLFSLPLIISNVLQILFNMSDIAVVGKFSGGADAGTIALGAVGSTSTIVAFFTAFLIGMGSGVNVIVARYIGMNSKNDLRKSVHTSAIICTVFGFIILAVGELTAGPLLLLLGTKPTLIDGAILYLRIYFIGMPALAVYNFGNAVLSASGDTRNPLYILGAAGILNVLLNLLFVIVFKMSVAGVAVASIIAQYLSAFTVLTLLIRNKGDIGLHIQMLKYDKAKGAQIIGLGLPAGFQNAIFQIANLFIQGGLNTFDDVTVSGATVTANIDYLVYDVMAAFYTGCAVFMSANYGAGNYSRVKKSYFWGLFYSFTIAFVMGTFIYFLGNKILMIFTDQPEVITAGIEKLKVMAFSYAISAFMDCTISASRGLGKSLVPTVIVIMGSCVFRVVWVYTVFPYFGTITSLFSLYPFSWTITAIAEIAYFVICYRKLIPRNSKKAV